MFPPTTAAAVTTLLTATAPQQHAVTGWFLYLRELGTVTAFLTRAVTAFTDGLIRMFNHRDT